MKAVLRKLPGLLVVLFLLYEIAGALLPFAWVKTTGEEFREEFQPLDFYGDGGYCVDRAAIVETSGEALDVRLHMIGRAEESIMLSTFDIREGESAEDIFGAVLEAAGRGVKVQILVDGLYGSLHMNGRPMFHALGLNPNVEIRFYNVPGLLRPWTVNGRMHDKYLIVDDELLLMGGRNTFDYFLGEYEETNVSYDRDVLIYNTAAGSAPGESSVISQVNGYFQKMWDSDMCEAVFTSASKRMKRKAEEAEMDMRSRYRACLEERPGLSGSDFDYTAVTTPVEAVSLISNPTGILAKEPWVWYQLQYLMANAKDRVYVHTPYAVFSRDMYEGMAEVAANVEDCRMLLNSTFTGDNFMASSDYTLNRKKILDTGVKVFEFFGEHSSHGKSILIDDDLSIIGSYNMDMRSTYVDTETMLVIHGEEFNALLEQKIFALEEEALSVDTDGNYLIPEGKEDLFKELSAGKKAIFAITSLVFQLIRYLL